MNFGREYSSLYDSLYYDQDFISESDAVICNIQRYNNKCQSLLDFGCGTGNHSSLLSKAFDVVGVDRSNDMLSHARRKSPNIEFVCGDIRTVVLNRQFDSAIMMSAVLGYQLSNDDVFHTLLNIRRHLVVGAPLIFDVWNGPVVLSNKPTLRCKEIGRDGVRCVRVVTPTIHPNENCVTCDYMLYTESDGVYRRTDELHVVRYFFRPELAMFCKLAGFEIKSVSKPGKFNVPLDDDSWHAMYVCVAI